MNKGKALPDSPLAVDFLRVLLGFQTVKITKNINMRKALQIYLTLI
jgi:hypothetical protein